MNSIERDRMIERVNTLAKNLTDKYGTTKSILPEEYKAEIGKRYAKVLVYRVGNSHHDRVYAFVDLTGGLIEKTQHAAGSILKPAGYSKPAKHARSNIYNDDFGMSACGEYGVAYMK